MKKAFITLACISSLYAGLVNGIAITVNNEPITLFELDEAKTHLKGISQDEVVEMLISKKLQTSEIKRLGISVDEFEIMARVEDIAKSNRLTLIQFKEILESKFISYSSYKDQLKEKIIQEKLANAIFNEESISVDDTDAKIYYQNHQSEFEVAKSVRVTKYAAQNKRILEAYLRNPLMINPSIIVESETIETSSLNPKLQSLILETKEGDFTPVIPYNKTLFVAMLVDEKLEKELQDYERVKQKIMGRLRGKNERKSIERFFQKQRSQADVKIIRLP
jgi:peptidyl-prolyl cis-trans isomerase SurA